MSTSVETIWDRKQPYEQVCEFESTIGLQEVGMPFWHIVIRIGDYTSTIVYMKAMENKGTTVKKVFHQTYKAETRRVSVCFSSPN